MDMKAVKKAKPGRPAVYKNPRVSIAARLQAPLHEQIKRDAEAFGRSISEEIERRLELYDAYKLAADSARKLIADAKDAVGKNLQNAMRAEGYTQIRRVEGHIWAEPGADTNKLIPPTAQQIAEAVTEEVRSQLDAITRIATGENR
jgi:hypothetical protein